MKPKGMVKRGWWCPICLQCMTTKSDDYCNCGGPGNWDDDRDEKEIRETWLPVYSEPVRKGK